MTRKECFPNNHSWTHCTLYINSCSFPGKMFAVSYWAALEDPGNSAPADIQARIMKIMCSWMGWLFACQREPELAARGGLSSVRAQPPAPRGGCQHSMARRSWQQCEPPPLLPRSASPCHFLPTSSYNRCVFRCSHSKPEPQMFVWVLICQTGNSSKDIPAFTPTQAIQTTLHPACMTSITHLSLQ